MSPFDQASKFDPQRPLNLPGAGCQRSNDAEVGLPEHRVRQTEIRPIQKICRLCAKDQSPAFAQGERFSGRQV